MERRINSMHKTLCFCFFVLLLFCKCNTKVPVIEPTVDPVVDPEIVLLENLEHTILCKPVFYYLKNNNVQKKNWGEIEYSKFGPGGIYKFEEAFEIISQEPQAVYKKIQFIENYNYYGVNVLVHKIPNGSENYYMAILKIGGTHDARLFYLFNEKGDFIDEYFCGAKYMEDRVVYEYRELQNGHYGILTFIDEVLPASGPLPDFLTIGRQGFNVQIGSTGPENR